LYRGALVARTCARHPVDGPADRNLLRMLD
jgi:hypothetical protein